MAARYPLVLNGTTIQELQSGDVLNGYVTPSSTDTLTNKTLTSPVINTPTGIVKGDVGLGNVDNTSDATKNSACITPNVCAEVESPVANALDTRALLLAAPLIYTTVPLVSVAPVSLRT